MNSLPLLLLILVSSLAASDADDIKQRFAQMQKVMLNPAGVDVSEILRYLVPELAKEIQSKEMRDEGVNWGLFALKTELALAEVVVSNIILSPDGKAAMVEITDGRTCVLFPMAKLDNNWLIGYGRCFVKNPAQQGDAPEPATNADPASRPPSAPAR